MILQLLRDDLVIWSSEMQRGKGYLLTQCFVTDLKRVDAVSK
jgi:hypothetical protein